MKIKNMITVITMATVLLVMSAICFFGEKDTYSESERRALAKFPDVTVENVMNGDFAKGFEEYATDAFPKRDLFRSIKAYTRLCVFAQKDNNGIYMKDGYLSKLEYPPNDAMQEYAAELFWKIYDKNLKNNKVYFSMIPDKNMFISDLSIDYSEFEKDMTDRLTFAEGIEIKDLLSIDDYYYTDTHWKQDSIVSVAEKLAFEMGVEISGEYERVDLDVPFYGVYVGQSAMSVKPDSLSYFTNDTIKSYKITLFDGRGEKVLDSAYDMTKVTSNDPYEMYLSGNQPLVTIENPKADNDKRLVIFRDSFGSSIAPLLAEGYSETVLIDLRYINSDYLPMLVDFDGADVLFLYSTLILNSSMSMK